VRGHKGDILALLLAHALYLGRIDNGVLGRLGGALVFNALFLALAFTRLATFLAALPDGFLTLLAQGLAISLVAFALLERHGRFEGGSRSVGLGGVRFPWLALVRLRGSDANKAQ